MSTSFLTAGRYANPVLTVRAALGDDPREIMRRAVLRGLVPPPPAPLSDARIAAIKRQAGKEERAAAIAAGKPVRTRRAPMPPDEAKKRLNAQKAAWARQRRADLAKRGLNEFGMPFKNLNLRRAKAA